jgi:disulfide bond formation protein DsbB
MKSALTANKILIGALCLSVAALAFAYSTQIFWGVQSCALCQYQRYIYMLIIVICLLVLMMQRPSLLQKSVFLVGFIYLGIAGVAFYQVLVEKKIVELPHVCKLPKLDYNDFSQFKRVLMGHKHVPCDEVTWSLFGISMAGYSAIVSLLAGLACLLAGMMVIGGQRVKYEH